MSDDDDEFGGFGDIQMTFDGFGADEPGVTMGVNVNVAYDKFGRDAAGEYSDDEDDDESFGFMDGDFDEPEMVTEEDWAAEQADLEKEDLLLAAALAADQERMEMQRAQAMVDEHNRLQEARYQGTKLDVVEEGEEPEDAFGPGKDEIAAAQALLSRMTADPAVKRRDDVAEILGQKTGWCKMKVIGKSTKTLMRKKATWKETWIDLNRDGTMQLKQMVNAKPLVTIDLPYAKLMDDPALSPTRFAVALKTMTYYFEAKTATETELWKANIEKCKKRNRRRSAYGRQAKKDESMMF